MVARILVVYATRAGSTAEIAREIGAVIAATGAAVDIRPLSDVPEMREFDAVVIGAPLYMGRVVSEIALFVREHQTALEQMPVAAFVVGGFLTDQSEKCREWARGLMERTLEPVVAREIGLFAGYINTSRMSFSQRISIRCLGVKTGDFRDWEMIREWARGLPGKLGHVLSP